MQILNAQTVKATMGTTKTYEDFHKFLGSAPHRLGIVARYYTGLTASYLTESLMNIYTNEKQSKSQFQSINSFAFEWDVDIDFIKRIEFAAVPEGDGANGTDIIMAFRERYYEKYDTFRVEDSRQLFIVKTAPIRKADNYWELTAQLIDADYSSILDVEACQVGSKTRWQSNYHPELSEEGYTKYQSNVERYRNHISHHRNDITWSDQYAIMEDVFIGLGQNKGSGNQEQTIYKLHKKEQELLDSFMTARNNAMLLGKSNYDKNGKCTVTEAHTGRPIPMGDGLIAQIERYANKYSYARITTAMLDQIMANMTEKSANPEGNSYVFVVNNTLYAQLQKTLREYLRGVTQSSSVFYSQKAGGKVKVGTTFDTYEFMGNQITFKVDKALSIEYPNKGYGLVLDMTADMMAGKPAMAMFTIKGGEFIRNTIKGVGGTDGVSSGDAYTPVAGSKLIYSGYAGIGVFSPFRSMIIEENK